MREQGKRREGGCVYLAWEAMIVGEMSRNVDGELCAVR